MANELTGDFDVVAEFSLPAVNRLLAAMHSIKRFPHSLSLRVDDIPKPPGGVRPSVFEVVDIAGDAIVNPTRIRVPSATLSQSSTATVAFSHLDGIVNLDDLDIFIPPTVPSRLQGRVQLQFSPPTLEIADASASRITVRIQLKSRYFADRDTPPASEFAKGDLILTTAVNQITSQAGNVVDIDLRSDAVQAAFVPTWSSRPLSAEDRAGINLLISNALKSSVLPSNNTLPSNIRSMKFKALTGAQQAIAVLLNTTSTPGNPATVTRVFLGGSDFAFGVGADTIKAALQPGLDEMLTTPIAPISIRIPLVFTTATATYTIKLNTATADLQDGRILLTIRGRATAPEWFAPNFDFTATQALGLQAVGSTADLVVGEMTFDTTSSIVDRFRGRALERMATVRDRALAQSGVRGDVRRKLDANRNLGDFLRSLLTPARPDGQPQPQPLDVSLSYSSAEISPAGIALRGVLAVPDWPPAHVEFEEIAGTGGGLSGDLVLKQPEFSGLKSWIGGGAVQSFEWKRAGEPASGFQDDKKFVLLPEAPVILDGRTSTKSATGQLAAFSPMCLTLRGTRLSPSGAVTPEPVVASYCAFQWFPVLDVAVAGEGPLPLVPLTRPGPRGDIEIVGHAPAVREERAGRPNLIVHFAGSESAPQLERLTEALTKSGRTDAATAIVAVLSPQEMARARYVPGVVYLEDQDGAWERRWRVKVGRRPATFVIGPTGQVLWENEGEVDSSAGADALRKVLVASRLLKVTTITSGVRIGHAPPNFVFSHARASDLTLRKLAGRPVIAVFWRSTAWASIEAVRDMTTTPPRSWSGAVVLAINDGESREVAEKAAANARLTATVVPDPTRSISRAYGVAAWPTLVFLDARGLVREVQHGRGSVEVAPDIKDASQDAAGASAQ